MGKLFDFPDVKRSECSAPLIVDSFAGGGGASTGIEMALGRSPDIAINHSADALAMHEMNHPATLHLSKNIWHVDPFDTVGNRRVGLAWFSPDCKHFSKAKGGRPVKRNIRDLAWVVVLWAKRVRPEVIMLENVEEFRDWGPLVEKSPGNWVPCPKRKGQTFRKWTAELKRLGYRIEWRELRACDYGAPTIRKRFFMIARCDGRPIVWPEPTHGAPDDPDVVAGRKKPWRTAAEIIDWSLPCPSIFDTSEEIKAKYGVRAIRPLAEATMKRIARGVVKYVLQAERPFLVSVAHGYSGGRREYDIDEPVGTQTSTGNGHALVVPVITAAQHGGSVRDAGMPIHTITASPKDQNALIAASVMKFQSGATGSPADAPLPTVTANSYVKRPGGAAPLGVLAATMVQTGYGECDGQAPRVPGLDKPIGTQVAGGAKHALVAAFLAQHNSGVTGHDVREPVSTVTTGGSFGASQQSVVAAHLMNMKGSDRRDVRIDEPLRTLTAGGGHAALIAPFLAKYYGTGDGATVDGPMHTDTTKDRFGLVCVEIDGQTYAITDIGMRMLTPRERFRAQGFPEDYIIDRRPDGSSIPLTVQGSCCGNSVCPPLAAALVAANCGYMASNAGVTAA